MLIASVIGQKVSTIRTKNGTDANCFLRKRMTRERPMVSIRAVVRWDEALASFAAAGRLAAKR